MSWLPILIFTSGAVWMAYVLIGYPLLLAVIARIRSRPVRKAPLREKISVLLPVYNGEAFLEAKLQSLFDAGYPAELMEVIVLSDGSTDRTDEIARKFASRGVRLIHLPRGGKAAALNHGIQMAQGRILVLTDVRQSLEPGSLERLLEPLADPEVGVSSGDLVIRDGKTVEEADVGLFRRYESWIRARLSVAGSIIGATGCYYAIRRHLARSMPADLLLDDVFLPLGALFAGYRCVLEPGARAFDYPTALHSEFQRKVRTQAGIYQLIGLFPRLLLPWTRGGFHFLSLKIGRLMLPFALLAMLVSSFGLPDPWRPAALAGQAIIYGLAAVDLLIPQESSIKRVTSPLRSFFVLVASALCAVSIFVRPARTLWKETRVSGAPTIPGSHG